MGAKLASEIDAQGAMSCNRRYFSAVAGSVIRLEFPFTANA